MQAGERAGLLGILRQTPRRLADAVRGVPRALLVWTPAPGKWSILEIVGHMRDMERDAYLARYRAILSGSRPALADIDPDACAAEGDYRQQRLSAVLRDWRRLRQQTVALLDGVGEGQWALEGVHETDGALGMETLLARQARGNDLAHLEQIEHVKERHAILGRLAATPHDLDRVLHGVPDGLLRLRPDPARWSMLEHLCHLRDFEQLALERYSRMSCSEHPKLRTFAPEALAARRRYADSDPRRVQRDFGRLRALVLELLHALVPQLWRRKGVHPERGEVSIEQLVAHHVDHDATHLGRLRSLRAAASDRPAAASE